MSFGAHGDRLVRELTRELRIRRAVLLGRPGAAVSVDTLLRAATRIASESAAIERQTGVPAAAVVGVSDSDRARARAELRLAERSEGEQALRAHAMARLLDPLNPDARPGAPAPRIFTTASAAELIAAPELVAGYCRWADARPRSTLLITAGEEPDLTGLAERLRTAMLSVGVDPDACPDLELIPGGDAATHVHISARRS
jgi:hypothetical protein